MDGFDTCDFNRGGLGGGRFFRVAGWCDGVKLCESGGLRLLPKRMDSAIWLLFDISEAGAFYGVFRSGVCGVWVGEAVSPGGRVAHGADLVDRATAREFG